MAETWRIERSSSQADGTYLYAVYDGETVVAEDLTLEVARLLAAAPELLRALQDIVVHCRDGNEPWLVELQRSRIEAARVAIANAQGS